MRRAAREQAMPRDDDVEQGGQARGPEIKPRQPPAPAAKLVLPGANALFIATSNAHTCAGVLPAVAHQPRLRGFCGRRGGDLVYYKLSSRRVWLSAGHDGGTDMGGVVGRVS